MYSICNLASILIFTIKTDFRDELDSLLHFIDSFYQNEENIVAEYYKLISDSNETLKDIIEKCFRNNMVINYISLGIKLLSIFVKYFLALETLYNMKYNVINTKLFFCIDNEYMSLFYTHGIENVKLSIFKAKSKKISNSTLFQTSVNISTIYEHVTTKSIVEPYIVTLDSVNSWHDIPLWRIICLENIYYFDLCFLIKTIYFQLNSSNYNNPQPTFPCNPFTKQYISIETLHSIKFLWNMIHKNLIPKNNCFNVFIQNCDLWYIDSVVLWRDILIQKYNESLRWKRIQNIDSQNNFQGIWVDKYEETNHVEKLINKWLDTNNKRTYKEIIKYDLFITPDSNIWNCNINLNPLLQF